MAEQIETKIPKFYVGFTYIACLYLLQEIGLVEKVRMMIAAI